MDAPIKAVSGMRLRVVRPALSNPGRGAGTASVKNVNQFLGLTESVVRARGRAGR
jgi:hypothetical protein